MHALTVFQQNFAVAERLLQQLQLAGGLATGRTAAPLARKPTSPAA